MAAPPTLKDIAGEVDICPSQMQLMVNRKSGECWAISEEEMRAVEDDHEAEELDQFPDWQKESLAKAREILSSDDWLEFPKEEYDEYDTMRNFIETLTNSEMQDRLRDAIHGKGAFRRFRDAVYRCSIQDQWYAFRNEELERFVAHWLDAQGIAYTP